MTSKFSSKKARKDESAATPAYRNVIAELRTCEERYSGLLESMGAVEDGRLASAIAVLESEVRRRRELEAELLTAVDFERQRIGQDLHDHLCQELGAAALIADSVAKRISRTDTRLGLTLAEISTLINRTIGTCRDLARGLHPVTLAGEGLPAALQELAARIPVAVKFSAPRGKRIPLKPSVALHLYRIAEEAVANAVKHAEAGTITIELDVVARRQLALVITDDGKGIGKTKRAKGMGLRNMHYRANAIGSKLTIEGREGGGTVVSCRVRSWRGQSDGRCDRVTSGSEVGSLRGFCVARHQLKMAFLHISGMAGARKIKRRATPAFGKVVEQPTPVIA